MLYMTFCASIYMFWYNKEYCPFYDNHDPIKPMRKKMYQIYILYDLIRLYIGQLIL